MFGKAKINQIDKIGKKVKRKENLMKGKNHESEWSRVTKAVRIGMRFSILPGSL